MTMSDSDEENEPKLEGDALEFCIVGFEQGKVWGLVRPICDKIQGSLRPVSSAICTHFSISAGAMTSCSRRWSERLGKIVPCKAENTV